MQLLLGLVILVGVGSAMAAAVAARAWSHRPARMFVWFILTLVLLVVVQQARAIAEPGWVPSLNVLATVSLSLIQITLLFLLSSLFVPVWWLGRWPIRWITLPYLLITGMWLLDMLLGWGWFFVPGSWLRDLRLATVRPGSLILIGLYTVGWVVQMVMLGYALVQQPSQRRLIGTLLLLMVGASAIGYGTLPFMPVVLRPFVQTLPILVVLGYAVLRTRLVVPDQAGVELALQSMRDGVVVLDLEEAVVLANPVARQIGVELEEHLPAVVRGTASQQMVVLGNRRFELYREAIHDQRGKQQGWLVLLRDITELQQQNEQLALERNSLAETVAQLDRERQEREQLANTVQQLTTPLVPVLDGVIALPLVGHFDQDRQHAFIPTLLNAIEQSQAHRVLLDVTGVTMVDQAGTNVILRGVAAAGLLGARCTLVGVRPEIAELLVASGASLEHIETAATLQQAVQAELVYQSPQRFDKTGGSINNIKTQSQGKAERSPVA